MECFAQSQRSEAASAALQAERAERTSLAERLAIVVRERDGIRHDVDALRAELTACNTSHDCEIQVWWPLHAHDGRQQGA